MIYTSPHPTHPSPDQFNRRLKYLFFTCLVISITLHVVIFIGIIITSLTQSQRPGTAVSYVDISNIAVPSRQQIPTLSSPVQHTEQYETVQQPLIAPKDTINNSDKVPSTNVATDILATPLGLGMVNGYFSSLADGRTLREDIRSYYFDILDKINQRWWQNAGTLKEAAQQDGIIEILIDREGNLLDMRQIRSSGSREVDRAIIDAITGATPFPPLPSSLERDVFQAPLKISKPLHLFGVRNVQ